ncbi:MAG: aminoacyl-tRNA hydrolase [Phycisphaerales bacterium]|nr:aminoacyl-tRNA hydrolase [Phycisphaerales bacterium]
MGRIEINPSVSIDEAELTFTYARSPGPGGQNVNKVATKAILRFNLAASRSLTETQKSLLFRKLSTRINSEGWLQVVCWRHRTQPANRREAIERFRDIVAGALRVPKKRRPTQPSRGSVERRLNEKRRRGDIKRQRRSGEWGAE